MADAATGTLDRAPLQGLDPPYRRHDAATVDAVVSAQTAPEASTPPPRAASSSHKRGFFERLREVARGRALDAAGAGEVATAPAAPTLDPLTIRQRLYGRGYIIPGDAAWLLGLVEPLQLGASSSLLDLAAGLGGPARTIAQASHARVTGLERDYHRAQQANAISSALGAAHLVRIHARDPETLELAASRFDGALGREATYAVAEKERFLRVVAQSLRSRGQIVLTDFVLDRAAGERDELAAWRAGLAPASALWTAAQYADCFKSLGFHLRHAEDISALYRRQIVAAWIGYMRTGDIRSLPAVQVEAVLAEAESCRRTVAALESGALKYHRLEAIAHYSFW